MATATEAELRAAGVPESMVGLKYGDLLRSLTNSTVYEVVGLKVSRDKAFVQAAPVAGGGGVTAIRADLLIHYVIVDPRSGKLSSAEKTPTMKDTLFAGAEGAGTMAVLKQLAEDEAGDPRAKALALAGGHKEPYFSGVLSLITARGGDRWDALTAPQRNFLTGAVDSVRKKAGYTSYAAEPRFVNIARAAIIEYDRRIAHLGRLASKAPEPTDMRCVWSASAASERRHATS